MTRFVSFRSHNEFGAFDAGQTFTASADDRGLRVTRLDLADLAREARDKDVLFATHGFNVSLANGINCLSWLEQALALPAATTCFVGVLWPGDAWLPIVNYPIEPTDAIRCGKRLAAIIDSHLEDAASISFVSHSLGARVVLQAAASARRLSRQVCVTAAAVNSDALTRQYEVVRASSERVAVLSSTEDWTLRLAYPLGEGVRDLAFLRFENRGRGALGLNGPRPTAPGVRNTPIPAKPKGAVSTAFDHGDYYPKAPPTGTSKADVAARYIRAVFDGAAMPPWP